MTRGVVENAAARYQAQGRVAGCAVNGFRREPEFGVPTYAGDAENSGDPVGERHIDAVPGAEGAQAEEDSRTPIAVEVTFDDRRPDLAGRRRVLVPCRLICLRVKRRYLDHAVEPTSRGNRFEFTPMAGILTDTGTERCNDGPWALPADSPIAPDAARDGCGACSWALTATPAAAPPPMMRRTPTTPATRARRLPDVLRGGA